MDATDLAKLVGVGKSYGLAGPELQAYVEQKEREKPERDERAHDREDRKQFEKLQGEIERLRRNETQRESDIQVSYVKAKVPKLPPFDDYRDNIDAY